MRIGNECENDEAKEDGGNAICNNICENDEANSSKEDGENAICNNMQEIKPIASLLTSLLTCCLSHLSPTHKHTHTHTKYKRKPTAMSGQSVR